MSTVLPQSLDEPLVQVSALPATELPVSPRKPLPANSNRVPTPPIVEMPLSEPPVLEPPAQEPPIVLVTSARSPRSYGWRETPCWLSSLVLHLLGFVVFASLAVGLGPPARRTWLDVAFSTVENVDHLEIVKFTNYVEVALPSGSIGQNNHPVSPTTDSMEGLIPSIHLPADRRTKPALQVGASPQTTPVAFRPDATPGRQSPKSAETAEQLDYIVDRFIEYDIGRLAGQEGQRALADFNRLGQESIPALVRGLNRSAYIQASCPVGVISNKLTSELQRCDDPELLQYAVENIGREVPSNTPHYHRIMALRLALVNQHVQDREAARHLRDEFDITYTPKLGPALQRSKSMHFDVLKRELQLADPERVLAATIALARRAKSILSPKMRLDFARRLVEHLESADSDVPRVARVALQRLATGIDSSVRSGSGDVDFATAQEWRAFWDDHHKRQTEQLRQLEQSRRNSAARNAWKQ